MATQKETALLVQKLVQPICDTVGVGLWDVTYLKEGGQWVLRITIEKEPGVDIEDCEKVKESFNLVHKQVCEVLTKLGLEEIKAIGEEFDPNFHEAVMQTPTSEHPEHTVITELQKGYKVGDKVLRPTLVNVATAE